MSELTSSALLSSFFEEAAASSALYRDSAQDAGLAVPPAPAPSRKRPAPSASRVVHVQNDPAPAPAPAPARSTSNGSKRSRSRPARGRTWRVTVADSGTKMALGTGAVPVYIGTAPEVDLPMEVAIVKLRDIAAVSSVEDMDAAVRRANDEIMLGGISSKRSLWPDELTLPHDATELYVPLLFAPFLHVIMAGEGASVPRKPFLDDDSQLRILLLSKNGGYHPKDMDEEITEACECKFAKLPYNYGEFLTFRVVSKLKNLKFPDAETLIARISRALGSAPAPPAPPQKKKSAHAAWQVPSDEEEE